MTEEQKKRVAVFRFRVIHDLINGNGFDQSPQEELLRQKCARKWEIIGILDGGDTHER